MSNELSHRLSQRLDDDGPMTPQRAVAMLVALTRQVAALHAAGRIHRAIDADHVVFDAQGRPTLLPASQPIEFGGLGTNRFLSPPELRLERRRRKLAGASQRSSAGELLFHCAETSDGRRWR